MQLFLDAYLQDYPGKPVGVPDPSFLVPGFNLDGWDRSEYLGVFWVADDAEMLDGKGATLVYYDGDWVDYYDAYVNGALSPYDLRLPVLGEYYLAGETYFDSALHSGYQSLWSFFMLENPDDTFSFVAPGPVWEAAWLVDPPEDFHFIAHSITVNGAAVYRTERLSCRGRLQGR